MSLVVHFKHFDPLAGRLPERYDWQFAELAARARRLLTGRRIEEVKAAARFLTDIHRAPGYQNPLWEELKQPSITTKMDGQEIELIVASNEVEALYKNVANVTLGDYQDFPNAQWSELFAVVALSYMEQICGAVHALETWQPMIASKWFPEEKHPNPFPRLTDADIDGMAIDCLRLAQQAMSFADALKTQTEMLQRMRSEEKRQAAKKRHKASDSLKQAALQLYAEKYTNRSNRDAAYRVFNEMETTGEIVFDRITNIVLYRGKRALTTDDPEHRLAVWIGDYINPRA